MGFLFVCFVGANDAGAASGGHLAFGRLARFASFWSVKDANCSAVVWLASLPRLSRNGNVRASFPSLVWLV